MSAEKINDVLQSMMQLMDENRAAIVSANAQDVDSYPGGERAMLDRLKIDDAKMQGMIQSVREVRDKPCPVGFELYRYDHPNGMTVINRTAPFGTILIIYESRPDVTVEAAALAFKAGNKILLKGGKEARRSNLELIKCWHKALEGNGLCTSWVQYLDYPREKTQAFLKAPDVPVDLIVPRGGERLISFVKEFGTAPVLVSGRGNNFVFIHRDTDWEMVVPVVLNAKIDKISACNALDKVLVDKALPDLQVRILHLIEKLQLAGVEILISKNLKEILPENTALEIANEATWYAEFLAMKIMIGVTENVEAAIEKINKYSGGHSASILTEDKIIAKEFMERIDAAAVFHNASTRLMDGGQFGMGAELAISTDKVHHRGPLGLSQLVSNKWYVYGAGQTR